MISRFLVLFLLIIGCEREPVLDHPADADSNVSIFQNNVVRLDTLLFMNPVISNGQVRFDLTGTPPEIKAGNIIYYPGGNGISGKVISVSLTGSRMVFQLDKSVLDEIFRSVIVKDTSSHGLLKSRVRTDADSWFSDSLSLDGFYLYNGVYDGNSLKAQFTSGRFHSKSGTGDFVLSAQGSDPWFDRIRLDLNYSLDMTGELALKTGGIMNAIDSMLVETSVYGPFSINGFPVTYQIDTWLGFRVMTQRDTVVTLKLYAVAKGNLSLRYNYWETWKLVQDNQLQSADIQLFNGPKLSDYLGGLFINQVVTPYFCGEGSASLSNRMEARISSKLTVPDWLAVQTVTSTGSTSRIGQALGDYIPVQLSTAESTLYTESQTGVLENQPPKAVIKIDPPAGFTDTNFEFDASASSDLETPVQNLMVRWDFDGDTHFDTEFSTSKQAFYTYPQPGVYYPVAEVRDAGGLTGRVVSSVEVTLSSSAPVAYFTVTPQSGRISDIFIFDAYGSYDGEDIGAKLKIRWDWENDGFYDTNWSVNKIEYHVYRVEGIYVAKLEVLDTEGLTSSTTRVVTVEKANIKPTPFFTVNPEKGTTQTQFRFDASGSTDPEDATADLEVRWDWENDGTFDTDFRTVKTIQHTFPVAGIYTVVMEVIDTELYGATYSVDVVVTNPNTPPTADFSISPASGLVNQTITFDASLSSDDDDSVDQLEVRWDWDNDNIYDTGFTSEKVFSRSFSEAGTYIIKVQVRDSGGLTDTRAKLLEIK